MNPLISATALFQKLSDPRLVILDCRANLSDRTRSRLDYEASHIPGSFYADLETDLSDLSTLNLGRHPLPSRDRWQATLRNWGIHSNSEVVVYDQHNSMFAARAWWMLRSCGVAQTRVLDGGLDAWLQAGFPVNADQPVAEESQIEIHDFIDTIEEHDVKTLSKNDILLDARALERYLGSHEPIDSAAGHIPGAINAEFVRNVNDNGTFKSQEELAQRFSSISHYHRIVCYCGSGVTACHNILSLAIAGLDQTLLFPGSWSQWSSTPENAIETQHEGTL